MTGYASMQNLVNLEAFMETKTLSLPSWKVSLLPLLFPENFPPLSDLPRIAIVGIGKDQHGDDAAGMWVARALAEHKFAADVGRVLVIETSRGPENVTADLRPFRPQVIILIDSVQMDLPAGEIAWVSLETTTSASSRNLPIFMLARYLTLEFNCTIHLLGIQPAQSEAFTPMSSQAQAAVEELIQTFCRMLFCH